MKQRLFEIKSNERIAKNVYRMQLAGDTAGILPGQFVNIRVAGQFLRRPISVCNIEEAKGERQEATKGYILTGSGTDEIISFSLEYPSLSECICTCDPVTLKTIVRANPGVVVVQNGVVIDKYNVRNR